MKFKKKHLKKLVDLYSDDVNGFDLELDRIQSLSKITVELNMVDNLMDFREGWYEVTIRHPKWTAEVTFVDGIFDLMVINDNK